MTTAVESSSFGCGANFAGKRHSKIHHRWRLWVVILSSLLLFVLSPARATACEPPAGPYEQRLRQAKKLKQDRACRHIAQAALEALYAEAPDHIEALYQLGSVYNILDNPVQAAACWGTLRLRHPGVPTASRAGEDLERISRKLTGYVRFQVETQPPGARVRLSPVGVTRLPNVHEEIAPFVRWLKPGSWEITATREGCIPTRTRSTVNHRVGTLEIALDCLPRGELVLTATEPSARALLDGEEIGRTPIDGALPVIAGEHRLRLEKPGCQPWEQTITIEAGKTLEVPALMARNFQVIAAHGNGVIKLDGKIVGELPAQPPFMVELHGLPGEHRVEIEIQGFAPVEKTLSIEPDQEIEPIHVAPKPVPTKGTLVLTLDREITTDHVLVDGQRVADLPLREPLDLTPGAHQVEVHVDGCQIWSKRVEIRIGEPQTESVALDCPRPKQGVRPATISWFVIGGASLIAGTMGIVLTRETAEERDAFFALAQGQRTPRRFVGLEREHAGYQRFAYTCLGAAVAELGIGITLLGVDRGWWAREGSGDLPEPSPSWLSPGNLSLVLFSAASAATGVVALFLAGEAHDEAVIQATDDMRRSTYRQAELEARVATWRAVGGVAFATAVAAGGGALIGIFGQSSSSPGPESGKTALRFVPTDGSGGQFQVHFSW